MGVRESLHLQIVVSCSPIATTRTWCDLFQTGLLCFRHPMEKVDRHHDLPPSKFSRCCSYLRMHAEQMPVHQQTPHHSARQGCDWPMDDSSSTAISLAALSYPGHSPQHLKQQSALVGWVWKISMSMAVLKPAHIHLTSCIFLCAHERLRCVLQNRQLLM